MDTFADTLLWLAVGAPLVAVSLITGSIAVFSVYCHWAGRRVAMDELQSRVFDGRRAGLARRLLWLAIEGVFQSFAFLLQGLHRVRILPTPHVEAHGMPVILLPGYTENSGQMWVLARRLAARGMRPLLVDFPSTFVPIRRNVAFLAATVARIRRQTGVSRVAIVGHSMGGVVARAYVHEHSDHGVATIVSIASPHRGTYTAFWGMGGSARDMRPGSGHCTRYPADRAAGIPIHSLIGLQENIVSPVWSCVLPDGDTVVLNAPAGHMTPLFLKETVDHAERWLEAVGARRSAWDGGA